MHLLTIARRAQLGSTIAERRRAIVQQLGSARGFLGRIQGLEGLTAEQERFSRSTFVLGLMSQVEAYLTDMAIEILVAFPGKIPQKDINLESLAKWASITDAIHETAERRVYELGHKRFPETVKELFGFLNKAQSLDRNLVNQVNEIKSTRDLLAHNNGIVNSMYQEKAGGLARGAEGRPIPLDDGYLTAALDATERFLEAFYNQGLSQYAKYDKLHTFREMWESTWLNKLVLFDNAWKVDEQGIPRPVADVWPWSSSEKMLYDFFLGIYSSKHPNREHDVLGALQRWSYPHKENRILRSWLESPFWF